MEELLEISLEKVSLQRYLEMKMVKEVMKTVKEVMEPMKGVKKMVPQR